MRLKLPNHFGRWIIFSLAAFLVGFIIAQFFIPTSPGSANNVKRLIGGAQAQATVDPFTEKQETSFIPIIVAFVALSLIVAYGYYREKRRK